MSIFKTAIEKKAEEAISLNPAVQTGYIVHTNDVMDKAIEHPLFMAFNNMSVNDTIRLRKDSIQGGLSVGLKEVNGTSRSENVFCNPKFSDPLLVGDSSGKKPVANGLTGMLLADVVFSGTNNQAPTIIGMQMIPKSISNQTQSSVQDVASNSPTSLQGEVKPANPFGGSDIGIGPYGVQIGSFAGNLAKVQGPPTPEHLKPQGPPTPSFVAPQGPPTPDHLNVLPPLLDKQGKPTKLKDKTQRGNYGNSIRTGTTKVTSSELSDLAQGPLVGPIGGL